MFLEVKFSIYLNRRVFVMLRRHFLLCISVLRVSSGPRVKLVSFKSALNSPVVYSTDRSKAVARC